MICLYDMGKLKHIIKYRHFTGRKTSFYKNKCDRKTKSMKRNYEKKVVILNEHIN